MNTPGSTAGTASNLRQIRSFVSAEDSTLSAATLEQIGAAVLQRSDGSFVGSAVDAATIAAAATALTRNPSMTREALQDLVQEVRALLPRVHILSIRSLFHALTRAGLQLGLVGTGIRY